MLIACLGSGVSLRAEMPLARLQGQPRFTEGRAFGYFVWKDGNTWKVRWTTLGAEHRFSGLVTLDSGQITSLEPVDADMALGRQRPRAGRQPRLARGARGRNRDRRGRAANLRDEPEDRIVQDDERRLHFDTVTDDDMDGFDFTVNDRVTRLRFRLEVDGRRRPEDVELGAGNLHPDADPLVVVLR